MVFDDLIKEFGLTIEKYDDRMTGAISLCFRSNDQQYGYRHDVSRDDLIDIDWFEIERVISEKVWHIFKARDQDMEIKNRRNTLMGAYIIMPKNHGRSSILKEFDHFKEINR